jgi:hypothetical protein
MTNETIWAAVGLGLAAAVGFLLLELAPPSSRRARYTLFAAALGALLLSCALVLALIEGVTLRSL